MSLSASRYGPACRTRLQENETEAMARYKQHPVDAYQRVSPRPAGTPPAKPYGSTEKESTKTAHYKQPPAEAYLLQDPRANLYAKSVPFEGTSTYTSHYDEKEATKFHHASPTPAKPFPCAGSAEKESTKTAHYKQPPAEAYLLHDPRANLYARSVPFEGTSTYTSHYDEKEATKFHHASPTPVKPLPSVGSMEKESEAMARYKQHPLEPEIANHQPCKDCGWYTCPNAPPNPWRDTHCDKH